MELVQPAGFFVLRTPLAPFQELTAWSEGLQAPRALENADGLEAALAADRYTLRARLSGHLKRPEIRDAIFVASPSLDESLVAWLEDPESERGQRVERALVRYFARLAGRPTPFGLFAGCSVGTIGGETRLEIAAQAEYRRHTRLDMDYLFVLADTLSRDAALRRAFTYRPNSSLYRVAGRVRYVESRLAGTRRSYHLVVVEPSEALDATLARARDGARFEALAAPLVTDDVSLAEAEVYVDELIQSQILVTGLEVPVTGQEPIHVLVDELLARPETISFARPLVAARQELQAIDAAGLGVPPERYRAIARSLESLPAKVELPRLFQVDMTKPASAATLGSAVIAEIVAGADLLRRLTRPVWHRSLDQFREAFTARYEGREVALVEALDEEAGIGFGASAETSPLLHNLAFPPLADESAPAGAREALLLRKLGQALRGGHEEIVLAPGDIETMATREPPPLPRGFAAIATIAAPSEEAVNRGRFRAALRSLAGPSGARLLGRFCHADERLRRLVEEHLRAEEALDEDAVFAEIVHLPEGRLGNILLRPVLRGHEIAYLGRSGAPRERQIPIVDLMISVSGGEIRLRSRSLGCRVIPRLTSAHNYDLGSLGVYRFLCALQGQGVAAELAWDWGPLQSAPFLPRVVTGKLVLARARWNAHKDELARLGRGNAVTRFRAVQTWRQTRRIPRWVCLADGDNELPVDLENALAVESFVHLAKDRDGATLKELFPGPEELCAHGPEGRFVHEIIVPFVSTGQQTLRPTRTAPVPSRASAGAAVERSFTPGSAWLFVKLYTGMGTTDQVLRDVVGPVVREAMQSRAVDRWFFIRYGDPDHHLRLRLHGAPTELWRTVWPRLQAAIAPFLDDGRIWRVTLDTYEREVERYGGSDGIELAEAVFHADSEAVLEIVELISPDDAGLDQRWRLTLRGMDQLLGDLAFDVEAKLAILESARRTFAAEFRVDGPFKGQIGERFRQEQPALAELLDRSHDAASPLAPGFEVLASRSDALRPVAAELIVRDRARRLSPPLRDVAASYLHMHANRLLQSASREHELLLYEFLTRLLAADAHRRRGRAGPGRE